MSSNGEIYLILLSGDTKNILNTKIEKYKIKF